ncbi:TraK domain-containing protein [Parasulfuritortus cantonensis]|nr:type-F conjugative transfer system secretin TraK [Parasulfuritortus cantonensis]
MKTNWNNSLAFCLAALAMVQAPAWALQQYEVKPDGAVSARIAVRETSRIKVEGARILEVFGSIYSPDNQAGELMASPDAASGELYVIPSAMATPGKPINIFVKTEKGTVYTLLLTPFDIPSDTVVLKDRSLPLDTPPAAADAAPDRIREIKAMELALRARTVPAGYTAVNLGRPVQLWQEARFVEMRRVMNPYLAGTVYSLTNISDAPMVLDAREFFDTDVAAVAVEREALEPGDTTRIHVIRERRGD